MKKTISMKSVRSMKSTRSMKSVKSGQDSFPEENTMEIEECIKAGCKRFWCPYHVVVVKETQRDYKTPKKLEAPVKYKKITVASSHHSMQDSDTPNAGPAPDTSKESFCGEVVVTAVHDNLNHLVELSLTKAKEVPRVLMQVIGLLAPYFPKLNKISMKASRISKYTIYELHKMLQLSSITEVCLDDSPFPESNYAILLDGYSPIRSLSLSRCHVNDDVCKQIVGRLRYLESGERNLCILNLSSNRITDVGVKYIGEALRTNRHLRYLNLAGNRITDEGARHIFHVLVEFPLTYEEVLEKRRRCFDYFRRKHAIFAKCLNEFDSKSVDECNQSKRATSKKKCKSKAGERKENSFSDDYLHLKAEMMTEELMGQNHDPFGPDKVSLKNRYSHCIGNFSLCYLNLSYNHLSYLSVKELLDIVTYQQSKKKSGQGGLMKVVIEGNNMPVTCNEMVTLNDILQRNINCAGSRTYAASARRKSAKISLLPSSDKV